MDTFYWTTILILLYCVHRLDDQTKKILNFPETMFFWKLGGIGQKCELIYFLNILKNVVNKLIFQCSLNVID